MSNIVDTQKIPGMKFVERCLKQYETDIDKALQRFRNETLFGLAVNGQLEHFDYQTVKDAITKSTAQRKLGDQLMIRFLRQELHTACAARLPPQHPEARRLKYHEIKRYPRWSSK